MLIPAIALVIFAHFLAGGFVLVTPLGWLPAPNERPKGGMRCSVGGRSGGNALQLIRKTERAGRAS